MGTLDWSRGLTEMTLAFHIIFATIGVGIPVLISIAEWLGIWKQDPHYSLMARRWVRGFVITVAVVTGTCIGVQLSLLWPEFMQLAGNNVIGLPWDRFSNPYIHWLLTLPIVIGASGSALFITLVIAFMNRPQGFTFENGKLMNVDPIAAMFNPAALYKVAHVLSSAYLTAAFILAMIAAFAMLKGRDNEYNRKSIRLNMVAGLILALLTIAVGDMAA